MGLATKAIRGWRELVIGPGLAVSRASGRWEDAHERRARGSRLYDLSIPCRGGADREGGAAAPARGLREHPARDDLPLLVGGRDRARRGGRDDHQDASIARGGGAGGREGVALVHDACDPGAADRGRGGGLSGLADEGDGKTVAVIPGREGASPESISTTAAELAPFVRHCVLCDYGFRAPRFARPRNDKLVNT